MVEKGVKAHMETEIYKSGMRQTSTSKSIKSLLVSPQDTHAQLKIVAAELPWAYHMNQHAFIVSHL